jgi:hypothetical protein
MKRANGIRAEIERVAEEFKTKIVKDPRFCLTIPAWTAHGADIRGVVVCLRHPTAIAKSLRKRNRIPLRFGYRLWRLHACRLEENVGRLSVRYVRYERLLDPQTGSIEIENAVRGLGINVSGPTPGRLYDTVVKREMNHHHDDGGDLPEPVQEVWDRLTTQHREQLQKAFFSRSAGFS